MRLESVVESNFSFSDVHYSSNFYDHNLKSFRNLPYNKAEQHSQMLIKSTANNHTLVLNMFTLQLRLMSLGLFVFIQFFPYSPLNNKALNHIPRLRQPTIYVVFVTWCCCVVSLYATHNIYYNTENRLYHHKMTQKFVNNPIMIIEQTIV